MGECIPIIEALSTELSDLQTRFPLDTTFESIGLPDLPMLLDDLPPRTGDDPATGFITECTNRAHTKLSQYYGLTDESTWFIAGMILNPTIKWRWCKKNWVDKPDWFDQAQDNMRRLWKTYKPTQAIQASSRKRHHPDRGEQSVKSVRREGNYRDSVLYNWRTNDSEDDEEDHSLDQYEEYLQEKRLPLPNDCESTATLLIDYWKDHAKKWPDLTRFAFDALSIPAMSAECERCFSSGKKMISDSRYSLAPDTIEACECNRHWIMHQIAS
jgi:hypothetical protein